MKTKVKLSLSCMSVIVFLIPAKLGATEMPKMWEDAANASNTEQQSICKRGGFYRKKGGEICDQDKRLAQIIALSCGEISGFWKTDCGQKIIRTFGTPLIRQAPEKVKAAVKSNQEPVTTFVCRSNVTLPAIQALKTNCTPARPATAPPPRAIPSRPAPPQRPAPRPSAQKATDPILAQAALKKIAAENITYMDELRIVLKNPQLRPVRDGKVILGGSNTGLKELAIPNPAELTNQGKQKLAEEAQKLQEALTRLKRKVAQGKPVLAEELSDLQDGMQAAQNIDALEREIHKASADIVQWESSSKRRRKEL